MAIPPSELHRPYLGKVMVIGGTGFLGHHVVNMLVESWKTDSISVVDLRTGRNRRPESDGVCYFEADITNAAALNSIFEEIRPDAVIHTASPPPQADIASSSALFKLVNIDGTKCVVEACQNYGVKALVYTSSASVVSDNKSDLANADETWPIIRGAAQTEYYAETKVHLTS
jgi:sterol-4alpha-carboxylate 3-dehydrogenase (decarboxylating)